METNPRQREAAMIEKSTLVPIATGTEGGCVILVPGITDRNWNIKERWQQCGTWLAKVGLGPEHAAYSYRYDIESDEPQIFSRQGMESEALNLLDCLMALCREYEAETSDTKSMQFVFVMLDIGGIIVKKALTIASLNPARYKNLDSLTSCLVFVNCPHRARRVQHYEDQIAEFLSQNSPYPSGVLRKIQNLAQSVHDINGDFLDTKLVVRAQVCNLVSPTVGKSSDEKPDVPEDEHSDSDWEEDEEGNEEDEEDHNSQEDDEKPESNGTTDSPKEPNRPFCFYGTPCELTYKTTVSHYKLVRGSSGLGEPVLEDIKAAIAGSLKEGAAMADAILIQSQAPPVYPPSLRFANSSSSRWVDRILDSQAYKDWTRQKGLAVLHMHGTSDVTEISQALTQRLNQADGRVKPRASGENSEALYFEFDRRDARCNNVHAMLTSVINVLISRHSHSDTLWAANLLERLTYYRAWSVEELFFILCSMREWDEITDQTIIISRLDECDESREWFVQRLAEARMQDHFRSAWIITSQKSPKSGTQISRWSTLDLDVLAGCGVTSCIGHTTHAGTAFPDQPLTNLERDLLICVQHAIRPMTVLELAIMLSLRDQAKEDVESCVEGVRRALAAREPLVYLENNELRPVQPFQLRMYADSCASHAELARRCLQYLKDAAVQRKIEEFCDCYNVLDQPPICLPRHNLITYAVLYWPWHYRLAGNDQPFRQALELFEESGARIAWSEAYYTLTNPLVRLGRSYLSALPLVSMLGLDDLVEEIIRAEAGSSSLLANCSLALSEAAQHGHVDTVRLLMTGRQFDSPALREAISSAASYGSGGALHDLVEHASKVIGFDWPPELLCRVSMLGLHNTAKVLLDAGLSPNPPTAFRQQRPLHVACLYGQIETSKVLLAARADIQSVSTFGRNPLHIAATEGCVEIVTLLLDAGTDKEAQDDDEITPLQCSVMCGKTDAMEALLKAGANPNHGKDKDEDPDWSKKPLLYCCQFRYLRGVRLLLDHKVDMNCKSGELSPLYLAVMEGDIEIARMLLENGADPNENPVDYDFLLIRAVELSSEVNREMIGLLLDHGARIEEEDNSTGWQNTALCRAAGTNDIDMVKYLISRGANVNHCGKDSWYPLYTAVWYGKLDIARILVDAGADTSIVSSRNWSLTHAAYNDAQMLRYFLDLGLDVNAISDDGTCLHLATVYNKPDTVKVLLTRKPLPDLEVPEVLFRDVPGSGPDDGYTALGLACEKNDARLVRMLVEAGANTAHTTRLGKRPLDICVQVGALAAATVLLEYRVPIKYADDKGNTVLHRITNKTPRKLVRMLVNAGADLHAANKDGVTPLQRAVESQNLPVAKQLLFKKADPRRCSEDAGSLVHLACARNKLAMVQALVKAGVDIQQANLQKGVPLVQTVVETWVLDDTQLLRYLVEEGQLDVNQQGGYMDYPLMAACAYRHVAAAQYLLERGANPDIQDAGGRRPLHMAAVQVVTDVVDILLDSNAATTVDGQPVRDQMNRTPVHFAAVGGNYAVFQKVSGLYDASELHRPDNEGWTPLFWALMNQSVEIELVQHLLDHGADLWARVKSRKAEWSPLKLARYCGVSDKVCNLLTPDPPVRKVGSKNKKERWDKEFHVSRRAVHRDGIFCDNCRVNICGIEYSCRICRNYDLCFRCFMSRDVFHRSHPGNDWDEIGQEYEVDETTTANDGTRVSTLGFAIDHTEADSTTQESGRDDDKDAGLDEFAELDDLSSNSSSFDDGESEVALSIDNDGDDDEEDEC